MNNVNILEQGIGFANIAVKYDQEQNYELAYKNYENALEILIQALQTSLDPKLKETIRIKATEYMQRAEYVKAIFDQDQITQALLNLSKKNHNQINSPKKKDRDVKDVKKGAKNDNIKKNDKNEISKENSKEKILNNKNNNTTNNFATKIKPTKNIFIDLVAQEDEENERIKIKKEKDEKKIGVSLQNIFEEIFSLNQTLLSSYEVNVEGNNPQKGRLFVTEKLICFCKMDHFSSTPHINHFDSQSVFRIPFFSVTGIGEDKSLISYKISISTLTSTYIFKMKNQKEGVNFQKEAMELTKKNVNLTRFFGVPLHELSKREGKHVPSLIEDLVSEISDRGLQVERIFRVNGNHEDIMNIKELLDREEKVDFEEYSVPTLCGLLKLWIDQIPGSITTQESNQCLLAAQINDSKEARLKSLKSFVSQLPIENQKMLKFLIYFFVTVSNTSDKNLMTIENLASVFSPSFFKQENMDNLTTSQIIEETDVMKSFFILMMEERQFIFDN
eukprot:TRINITY_DN2444_c1_g1_i1.p1 TRINITY_DN2444_c1_g1~~TRINITY_DN2444_c1_g1_i1.p1  ORF type:complete len:503 (-),score=164.58 TRINITY_DN2444_c1_g1_i1:38-1546(-)